MHETLFPGQPHEMVSIYHRDGGDLVMTHYCVLGNQPRMKADRNSSADQIHFQFAGGSNLDPAKDKHMHEATLTIVDADHIELKGVGWEGGARQGDVLRPEVHPQEVRAAETSTHGLTRLSRSPLGGREGLVRQG